MSTLSELHVQDVVSKIVFLSKIKPGEKIDTKNLSVWEDSVITQFYRTFITRESRDVTLDFYTSIVNQGFELAELCLSHDDEINQDNGRLIVSKIHLVRDGLASLAETYADDRMCISKIETISVMFENKLEQLERKYDITREGTPPPRPARF
jgi:hypothetical protein